MDEYVSRLEVALFSATGSLAAARGRDVAIVERERAHAGRDAGEGVKLEVSSRRLSRSRSRASSLSRDSTPPRRTHSGGRHSEREKNGTAKLLQLQSIPHSPRPSATCQQSEPTSVVCDVPLAKTLPVRAEGVTVEWRGISKREAFAKIQRYLTMGLIAAPCGRPSYRGKPFGNVRC